MSYPGNPSLGKEIQQKILGTYGQALDLAETGQREEALLGCDFIQRLDPDFKPALALQERLESAPAEVPVDDLREELDAILALEASPGVIEAPAEEQIPDTPTPVEKALELEPSLETAEKASPAVMAEAEALEDVEVDTAVVQVDEEPVPDVDLSEEETSLLEAAFDLSALEEKVPEVEPEEPEVAAAPSEPTDQGPTTVEAGGPEPSAALDQESSDRISELLVEGQAAFEKAEYQSAIDAWSRIFLVDIDHPEANRRIELARKLKAEVERKVDETFHEALGAMDDGSLEVAAEKFRKVLELQPSHLSAQEHLDRLSAGEATAVHRIEKEVQEVPAPEAESPPPPDEFEAAIPEDGFDYPPLGEGELDEFEPRARPAEITPKPTKKPSRRTAVMAAGLALLGGLVAAWYLYSNWDRFFPNAAEEATVPQPPKVDPIVRAQGLHMGGNTAMAISQLRRLPPAHPKYAEAQALIAQWETVIVTEDETGPSEEQLLRRDELVANAREAFANREFLKADKYFSLAAQVAPLDEGSSALQVETAERLEPLRAEIEIFRQGEWGYALRSLWRLHEEDPSNRDVLQLMVDGYFNLGVRDLQRGDPLSASENLKEAAKLADNDPEIQRLLDFADTYSQRSPDLLYHIFVKYQPFRS